MSAPIPQIASPGESFSSIVLRSLLRIFGALGLVALVLVVGATYAFFVEPHWLCVKRVLLSDSPTVRVIHISDVHFKGDRAYLEKVVRRLNGIEADAICFTGDLIEEPQYAPGALEILSKVNKPLFGVPGNHDCGAMRSFQDFKKAFRSTGGDWLGATPVLMPSKRLALVPIGARNVRTPEGYKRVILDHYPGDIELLAGFPFDVMLAGHTHGGQVRIPFFYRVFHDVDLGRYVCGLYRTPQGPLYVNPGIGTFYLNVRFLCRPEITVIEL